MGTLIGSIFHFRVIDEYDVFVDIFMYNKHFKNFQD